MQTMVRVQVRKRGNSASVRIPASLMAAAARVDQVVNVREENGRVVIEPVVEPTRNLDDLLSRMTPDTFHDAVDFGGSMGDEIWGADMSLIAGTLCGWSSTLRRTMSRPGTDRRWSCRQPATISCGA